MLETAKETIARTERDSPQPCLKALLACVDAQHERLGRQCLPQVCRALGDGDNNQVVTWNLERLGSPISRMLATLDVVEAHAIVVAAARQHALSTETREWIRLWPSCRLVGSGALIVVLTGANSADVGNWPEHALLRQTAQRCRLEYKVYVVGTPTADDVPIYLCQARQLMMIQSQDLATNRLVIP